MLRGAVYGSYTWVVYGVVEFVLTCVISQFSSDLQISTWQWPLIAQIFLVYVLAGAMLGAFGGFLTGRLKWPAQAAKTFANLTLAIAFMGNLVPAWPLSRSEDIALGVALLLALVLTAVLASSEWRARLKFVDNPWVVTLLLVSGPWMSRDLLRDAGAIEKTAASLCLLAAILLCAWIFRRMQPAPKALVERAAAAGFIFATLGLAIVASSKAQPVAGAASGKPNIIVITMDTVRADHLSAYGYERNTTPNLKAFAASATLYTRAMAAADFTLPSHASMFTGLYPAWHGAVFAPPNYPLGRPLGENAVTLADQLRAHGYWTAAIAANRAYLAAPMGVMKGVSDLQSFRPILLADPGRPFYLRLGAEKILSLVEDCSAFEAISLRASDVNRRAYALLDRVKPGAPFFLFLNYMDAHQPYVPPAPFDTLFPGKMASFRSVNYEPMKRAMLAGKARLSPEWRAHLISQYDGGIAYMDAEIGKLLGRLRETGLYNSTLIVITSDHGEAFGEHGILEHAVNSVYQDQLHVPLMVKYPHQAAAEQSEALVSQVDLMPTVLELVGLPVPPGLQGRSMRSTEPRAIYSEARPSVENKPGNIRRAVFDGSGKLIASQDGTREMYDLQSDPLEEHNLYDAANPAANALEERLTKWVASMPGQDFKGSGKLDKSTIERLKSLGYVQ